MATEGVSPPVYRQHQFWNYSSGDRSWQIIFKDLDAFIIVSVLVLAADLAGDSLWNLLRELWLFLRKRWDPDLLVTPGENQRPNIYFLFRRNKGPRTTSMNLALWLIIMPIYRLLYCRWKHPRCRAKVYKPKESWALFVLSFIIGWGTLAVAITMSFYITDETQKVPAVVSNNQATSWYQVDFSSNSAKAVHDQDQWRLDDAWAADAYYRACYIDTNENTCQSILNKPRIKFSLTPEVECPFSPELCYSDKNISQITKQPFSSRWRPFRIQSSNISMDDLGINTKYKINISKTTTCAAVNVSNWASANVPAPPPPPPNNLTNTTFSTHTTTPLIFDFSEPSAANNFDSSPDGAATSYEYDYDDTIYYPRYILDQVNENPFYLPPANASVAFNMDKRLQTTPSGLTSVILLSAQAVGYSAGQIDDPLFGAHRVVTNASDYSRTYYRADYNVTALACTDSLEMCDSSSGTSICTGPFNVWNSTAFNGNNTVLFPRSASDDETMDRLRLQQMLSWAFLGSTIGDVVLARHDQALNASRSFDGMNQISLPEWPAKDEVYAWFGTTLATAQLRILGIATQDKSQPLSEGYVDNLAGSGIQLSELARMVKFKDGASSVIIIKNALAFLITAAVIVLVDWGLKIRKWRVKRQRAKRRMRSGRSEVEQGLLPGVRVPTYPGVLEEYRDDPRGRANDGCHDEKRRLGGRTNSLPPTGPVLYLNELHFDSEPLASKSSDPDDSGVSLHEPESRHDFPSPPTATNSATASSRKSSLQQLHPSPQKPLTSSDPPVVTPRPANAPSTNARQQAPLRPARTPSQLDPLQSAYRPHTPTPIPTPATSPHLANLMSPQQSSAGIVSHTVSPLSPAGAGAAGAAVGGSAGAGGQPAKGGSTAESVVSPSSLRGTFAASSGMSEMSSVTKRPTFATQRTDGSVGLASPGSFYSARSGTISGERVISPRGGPAGDLEVGDVGQGATQISSPVTGLRRPGSKGGEEGRRLLG